MSGGNLDTTLYATEEFVTCNPLSVVVATNGIDTNSFQITGIFKDDTITPCPLVRECEWDGTSVLTIFRPTDLSVANMYIFFTFADVMGNYFNYPCHVHVVVSAISSFLLSAFALAFSSASFAK